MSSSTYINDVWSLYFHDPYDMNWDANSYKFITTISSVEDFVNIYKAFEDLWLRGMFFIMREHIMPRWEDENNIHISINIINILSFIFLSISSY